MDWVRIFITDEDKMKAQSTPLIHVEKRLAKQITLHTLVPKSQ
jgi:hypothetical protein